MEPHSDYEPWRDPSVPGFVEDGERFDNMPKRRGWNKGVRSIAAILLSAMLFSAGTPISWVSALTALLMLLIWMNIGSNDHDNTI